MLVHRVRSDEMIRLIWSIVKVEKRFDDHQIDSVAAWGLASGDDERGEEPVARPPRY